MMNADTVLRVFTWKINSCASQMLLPLQNRQLLPCSPCPPYTNTPQLSPLSTLSDLNICYKLSIFTSLHILLTYHPRLSSSKRGTFFLTLPSSLCLVSSVHLIKYLWNMNMGLKHSSLMIGKLNIT